MKIKSTLPEQPFFVHVASLLNLIVIIMLIMMGTNRIGISRGFEIQLPKSQFVLAQTRNMATITVSAGDDPVFFLNDVRQTNLTHLDSSLDKLKSDTERLSGRSHILVVLMLDASVSTGLQQQLAQMVINKGMACGLAADPI